MHILILNWKDVKNPDVGGAEIILLEFAKRMVAEGHKVTWFCRQFSGSAHSDSYDGIDIIRRGNRISVYFEAYKYYRSLVRKPDKVLDCLNTIAWQTPLYVPQGKRIFYVNQLAREVFFYELPPVVSHLAYVLENLQFISYKNTKTVCYSDSTKTDLANVGIPKNNISVFPIGLDHDRYKPGTKSKTPLFVFVGRLVRMKRADMCIKAMVDVVRSYPEAKLAIVGYGKQEQVLQKLIRELKLEKNVEIVNKNNLYFSRNVKDVKVTLLQEAWVLLVPSVKEGWGMVVTEAAACGTPAIVTDVTGLRDAVVPRKTGIVLSGADSEKLEAAMIRIIQDVGLRQTLAKNAALSSALYTWDNSYREFKNIIGD